MGFTGRSLNGRPITFLGQKVKKFLAWHCEKYLGARLLRRDEIGTYTEKIVFHFAQVRYPLNPLNKIVL